MNEELQENHGIVVQGGEDSAHVVRGARDLCNEMQRRWEQRNPEVDWEAMSDLAYWRFCRLAGFLTGRIFELGATTASLITLKEVLVRFDALTEDIVAVASKLSTVDQTALERIRRAHVHCRERIRWLEAKIKDMQEFEARADKLSRQLAMG